MPNGSTCRKRRGKCNQPFTSLPKEGNPHGEEWSKQVPAWESGPRDLLLPHMGDIWGDELCPSASTSYLGWHGQAAGAAFSLEVFCPHSPKMFLWCLSHLWCSVMSELWEPAEKCLFPPPAQSIIMSIQMLASPRCFP